MTFQTARGLEMGWQTLTTTVWLQRGMGRPLRVDSLITALGCITVSVGAIVALYYSMFRVPPAPDAIADRIDSYEPHTCIVRGLSRGKGNRGSFPVGEGGEREGIWLEVAYDGPGGSDVRLAFLDHDSPLCRSSGSPSDCKSWISSNLVGNGVPCWVPDAEGDPVRIVGWQPSLGYWLAFFGAQVLMGVPCCALIGLYTCYAEVTGREAFGFLREWRCDVPAHAAAKGMHAL